MSKIPASVGRAKKKTMVEGENCSHDVNLSGQPYDQFRKEFTFLWENEKLLAGPRNLTTRKMGALKSHILEPLVKTGHTAKLPMIHQAAHWADGGTAVADLLIGPLISGNPEGFEPVTRAYTVVHPHTGRADAWPPQSATHGAEWIRYLIPPGPDGAAISGMLYGEDNVYYKTVYEGGNRVEEGVRVVNSDAFIYETLNGLDPGPPIFNFGPTFRDNLVSIDTPYNVKGGESLDTNDMVFFDLKSNFTYNQDDYVAVIKKDADAVSAFDERLLPNFYQIVSDYVEQRTDFKHSNQFLAAMPKDLIPFYDNQESDIKKPYILKHREYFATYASILSEYISSSKITNINGNGVAQQHIARKISKSKNILITSKNWDYLTKHSHYIKEFPLNVEISFRSEANTGISELLAEMSVDEPLLKTFAVAFEYNPIMSTDSYPREIPLQGGFEGSAGMAARARSYFSPRNYVVASSGDKPQVDSLQLNEFDFLQWLEDYKHEGHDLWDDGRGAFFKEHASFVGQEVEAPERKANRLDKRSNFMRVMLSVIGLSKIKKFMKEKRRTFEDVLLGKPCYSETVAYKVCKHIVNESGEVIAKPIQKFWISNNPNTELVKFYDTQVKFDARYKYVVYAYKVVIGTEYKYVAQETRTGEYQARNHYVESVEEATLRSPTVLCLDGKDPDTGIIWGHTLTTVHVEERPTVKIVEVPYYGFDSDDASTVRTYDDPPLPPNIEVIPYVGVNNMFLLNLGSAIGEHKDYVRAIKPTDNILFDKVREYQEISSEDKVKFRNDDYPSYFEIFRIGPDEITGLTRPPQSYSDFGGSLAQTIDGPYVSVKQKVLPNKKYYYTFRSIDSRGNISNPSPVYEIELVGNDLMFPIIKEHTFPERLQGVPMRQGRRFLYVKPNYDQVEVSAEKSGFNGTATDTHPILGVVPEEPLFNSGQDNSKRFKIRLTSKKSGKKIDFNVRFKHEHENFK